MTMAAQLRTKTLGSNPRLVVCFYLFSWPHSIPLSSCTSIEEIKTMESDGNSEGTVVQVPAVKRV